MEAIQSMASELLQHVALGALSLLAAYALYYLRVGTSKLRAQTAQLQDEGARQLLQDALRDVELLAEKSVGALEQTTAKALREAVRAGTTDREALLELGQQVFWEIKSALAPALQKTITQNLGSFDDYLAKCIEDAVRRVKQGAPPVSMGGG